MKRTRSQLLMIGCLALLFTGPEGLAIEATLTDDVAIDLSTVTPRKPNGASPLLPLKGNTRAVFLQFDLAAVLPPKIEGREFKATLRVFVSRVERPGKIRVATVAHPVVWNEDSATADLPALTTIGQQVISAKPAARAKSFLDIDVTPLLPYLAAGMPPLTLVVTGDEDTTVSLDSKENSATSHPAFLQISVAPYVPPAQDGEIPNPSVTQPIIFPMNP